MSSNYYSYSDPRIVALKKIRASFAVAVLLTERLHELGINPFKTYLNTASDSVDEAVVSSNTLFDETLSWVEKEQLPNYVQGITGVFSRQYSFASKDRVESLDLLAFEQMVIDVVMVMAHAPSVNLFKRSVKSLDFEEVHEALKYRLPDVNIDGAYITAFSQVPGEHIILQSRSLAEDVYSYLQHDEIPFYHGEQIGVYSVAYSAQENHRHAQLTIGDISNAVIDILPEFLT
ncbi:hypothetical protein [Pseudomonas sp. PD9R]|uniref:hypothetical protein n=1 Tax=Pseudomonas sp. PD9R TaxID=2853534 RepID=UPI001C43C39D|nr:hypothetical protein [Pseudomonas sp. PD9R]MBV6822204.1 hypothetical protein [Pseudomonas sp. PD9R]